MRSRLRSWAVAAGAGAVLSAPALAQVDPCPITPELIPAEETYSPGEDHTLTLLGCPGLIPLAAFNIAPGDTFIPGIGQVGLAIDENLSFLLLAPLDESGSITYFRAGFCAGEFYESWTQVFLIDPFTQEVAGVTNVSHVTFLADPEPEFDCDANGEADACEILEDPSKDCNGNGILDACEIADGTLEDVNQNGIADECEPCVLPCRISSEVCYPHNGTDPVLLSFQFATFDASTVWFLQESVDPLNFPEVISNADGSLIATDFSQSDAGLCLTLIFNPGEDLFPGTFTTYAALDTSCDVGLIFETCSGIEYDLLAEGLMGENEGATFVITDLGFDCSDADCDGDNIPDDLESDCDGDGIPDDCDTDGFGSLRCASDAEGDEYGQFSGDHSAWIGNLGDFSFADNARLIERADGTALLLGTLVGQNDPCDRFELSVTLSGLVEPGDANYPPADSPKLELIDTAYANLGGPVDSTTWRYYTGVDGVLVGDCNFEGGLLSVERMGPALQIGVGANGKNVKFGTSSWIRGERLAQSVGGSQLPEEYDGDINVDLGDCSTGGDLVRCLDKANAKSFWLEGEHFQFSPLGTFAEYADGTAVLFGELVSDNDPTRRFCTVTHFSERVDPGDANYPPSGSPKLHDNVAGADPSDWYYYEVTLGSLIGKGSLEGAVARFDRDGPSFQVGVGANVMNFNNGASGWLDVDVLEQPITGVHLDDHYNADFNVDFVDCPAGCPEPAAAPLVHYDFELQSGDVVVDRAGDLDLELQPGNGALNWVSNEFGGGLFFDQYGDGTAAARSEHIGKAAALRAAIQSSGEFSVQVFFTESMQANWNARLISWSNSVSLDDRNFSLMSYPENGAFTCETRIRTTDKTLAEKAAGPYGEDQPVVLTVTYSVADGEMRSYVDGQLLGTESLPGNLGNWSDRPLQLGNEFTGDRGFRGTLYDVKIWDEALEDAQVLDAAKQVLGGSDDEPQTASLEVRWGLDACDNLGNFVGLNAGVYGAVADTTVVTYEPYHSKGHTCTADAVTGALGGALRVEADNGGDHDDPDNDTLYFNVTVDGSQSSETLVLESLNFFARAEVQGNNAPSLYGLKIRRNGIEVYSASDLATSATWTEQAFAFEGPDFAVAGESVDFEVRLIGYAPVGFGEESWDIDELRLQFTGQN